MNGYGLIVRSANRGNSNNVWNVNSTGNVNNNNARNSNRSAPDCLIVENLVFGCRSDELDDIIQGDHIPAERQNTSLMMLQSPEGIGRYIHQGPQTNQVESVIGFDALYQSLIKCQQGVLFKSSAAYYSLNYLEEILKQETELKNGTYKQRQTHMFVKTRPKRREFLSISFRDRVYQRSLNDNIIYPSMTKSLIHANMACQKKKGTDTARDFLKTMLRRAYRLYGEDFHVLQCDIKGYYPSLQHSVVKQHFRDRLSNDWYEKTESILDNQYTGEVGFNAGSQMVQIAGIAVLDKLDHFIKETLKVKLYVRYMDDFILIHNDEKWLNECRNRIQEELKRISLTLNRKKTSVYHVKRGIKFLGFRFHLKKTGKVLMAILPSNIKERRRILRKLWKKVKQKILTRKQLVASQECWRAHASKGDNRRAVVNMDRYFKMTEEKVA